MQLHIKCETLHILMAKNIPFGAVFSRSCQTLADRSYNALVYTFIELSALNTRLRNPPRREAIVVFVYCYEYKSFLKHSAFRAVY